MQILLIGNYSLDRQESMLRFADLMKRELTSRGHIVTLLQPMPYLGKIQLLGRSAAKWLGYADKFLIFPLKLRASKRSFDVVHICDHSNSMYVRDVADVPHVVTCHDVLAIKSALGEIPQNPVSSTGRKFQKLILAGLKKAQLIVCVSECTRRDLLRVTELPSHSATVVYLSLNYPYSPMDRSEALERLDNLGFDGRSPFFVHVGGTVWYKNKLGVLQIFRHLTLLLRDAPTRLLMAGKPLSESLLAFISDNGMENEIIKLSDLSNEDLRAAYSLAKGLIFPSIQEGFGWPVLEAQACGCPVFTTGRPPMNEIGGDGAVYFDPADPPNAAQIIIEALRESDVIATKGRTNALKFGVDRMIFGYEDAYRRALTTRAASASE